MSGVCGRGMRKLLFACVGLFGLAAPAVAADVAVPAASYQLPLPVLYSWTGCFIGFNIGFGAASQSFTDTTDAGHSHGARGGRARPARLRLSVQLVRIRRAGPL